MECKICGTKTYTWELCNECFKDENRTCTSYWADTVPENHSILADALDYAERINGQQEAEIVRKF